MQHRQFLPESGNLQQDRPAARGWRDLRRSPQNSVGFTNSRSAGPDDLPGVRATNLPCNDLGSYSARGPERCLLKNGYWLQLFMVPAPFLQREFNPSFATARLLSRSISPRRTQRGFRPQPPKKRIVPQSSPKTLRNTEKRRILLSLFLSVLGALCGLLIFAFGLL